MNNRKKSTTNEKEKEGLVGILVSFGIQIHPTRGLQTMKKFKVNYYSSEKTIA